MDRRIKKTKDNIKKTYMSLLSNKSCNEINVVDIVNKADINRSTFYFHYSSMNELMDEIENDVINKTNRTLKLVKELFFILAFLLKSHLTIHK